MTVRQLCEKFNFTVAAGENGLEGQVTGCYVCDLLSLVMGRAQEGDAWVTVQANVNVAAVAALAGVACVILPENIKPEQITAEKADAEGIPVISSEKTAFELAVIFGDFVGRGILDAPHFAIKE